MALQSSAPALDHGLAGFARGAATGLADLAVRSLGGAPSAEGLGVPAPAVDPLLDLRLPTDLRAWLKPSADLLGLTIEDGVARDKYGRRERRVTYLTNGEVRKTLLHIEPKVLADPSIYESLGMVMWAFEENAFVAVFATGLPEPPVPVNANVIDDLWTRRPLESHFISWTKVSELPTLDLVDQVEFMRKRLGLKDVQPRTASAGVGELTMDEIDRIVLILSALEHFNDARGRKTLLMQAGLTGLAADVKLEGPSKEVGLNLLWELKQHKAPTPPDNHIALGALFRTVIALPDTPPSDVSWLKALIDRCAL